MEALWSYRAFACDNDRCGCQRCLAKAPVPEPYNKKCKCRTPVDDLARIKNLKDPLCIQPTTEQFRPNNNVLVAQHRPPLYSPSYRD